MDINKYFKEAVKQQASDLHLIGGEAPVLRIQGELKPISDKKISNKELETTVNSLLSAAKIKQYKEDKELDFSHQVGETRFRINLHQQEGNLGLSARLIPSQIPAPQDLDFTPTMIGTTELLDGLVLVTGPTGCGKSTTLASLIEEINKKRKSHIVTIEDPVEFLFEDKMSLIEQREVGTDTKSFTNALKYVLRQDPDVILVGEMRDPETISTALTAAETGHLVFSTLHTPSASEAVERIVDVFEGPKQKQILIQLAAVLRVVIAQQLIPGLNGERVVAREILVNTPAVANLIRENHIAQIKTAIQTGAKEGMNTMENSIAGLLKEKKIDKETAKNRSGNSKKI